LHEALRQADMVITAEVMEIRKESERHRTVVIRPDSVLKGECPEKLLSLPVYEPNPEIGCTPPRVDFIQGGRYLLLLVRKPVLTVIHVQFATVLPAGSLMLKLVPVLLDLLEGKNIESRVQELSELVDAPVHSRLAYEAIELLTRRQSRPIQSAARRYFQAYTRFCPSPLPQDKRSRESYLSEILSNSRYTMDFRMLEQVRDELGATPQFLTAASRVCARPFASLGEFDAWWGRMMRRAYAADRQAKTRATELIPVFRSGNARARAELMERFLDLGSSILPVILPLTQDPDAVLRKSATALEDELRLLQDFADDLVR
jgi:hypothetical protein